MQKPQADPTEELRKVRQAIEREQCRWEELYKHAQPSERHYIELALDEMSRAELLSLENLPAAVKVLAIKDYARIPVPVRTFIYDDCYLGRVMKGNVFPRIIDDLETLFAGNYTEVVLGGAIGWGKTTFAVVAIAYELYRLSCLKDPALAYGMKPGSNMTFVNVSVNVTQATKVFFQDLYGLVKSCPYFQKIFRFDPKLKSEIFFPGKNVRCYPVAATEQAALGVGVFCAAIDEANFMAVTERSKRKTPGESGLYDQAEVVINKLKQRMRSRMDVRGNLPGKIYIMASARYPGDLTERMEEQARKEAAEGKRHMFVRHYALWDTRPPDTYLKETFKVEVGDITRRSRVLDGTETDVNLARVIEVPMNFKREFDKDPDACVRDYAGISTLSIKPFIVRREMIQKMFELGKENGLQHPFSVVDATLQHKDPDYERLLPDNLHWVMRTKMNDLGRPLMQNNKPVREKVLYPALYHAHFDLSKTGDATGLCVGHVVGTRKCLRFDEDRMRDTEEIKPVIRVDWVQRIVPPPHGEIDIPRVRALLYRLTALGMEFGSITCDTYGSQESVKTLKEKGYRADIFSLDEDKDGYSALKDAIYDGRVLCYENAVLERELAQLEDTGKKIDHPASSGASKDLADCLAAVVHHCEEGWRHGERIGGLFELGLVERPGEPKPNPTRDRAITKVAQGEKLTDAEESAITFGDLDDLG